MRVTYEGRTVVARLLMMSPNRRSLLVSWMATDDGMLGGHAGMMPILQDEATGEYFSVIERKPVRLTRVVAKIVSILSTLALACAAHCDHDHDAWLIPLL